MANSQWTRTTESENSQDCKLSADCDENSILEYVLISIGGVTGVVLIVVFFGVYMYRKNTKWKITKETADRRFSSSNSLSQPVPVSVLVRARVQDGSLNSQESNNDGDNYMYEYDYKQNQNPAAIAALNIHRLSKSNVLDTVLCFEDV